MKRKRLENLLAQSLHLAYNCDPLILSENFGLIKSYDP